MIFKVVEIFMSLLTFFKVQKSKNFQPKFRNFRLKSHVMINIMKFCPHNLKKQPKKVDIFKLKQTYSDLGQMSIIPR